ncbi:MAG: class I SAM-dependent methyltransferase [Myxococcales bacterium]
MKVATPRQEKIAAAYYTDIWPLVPQRAAEAILRQVLSFPVATGGVKVLEVGAAAGLLTLHLAERMDYASHLVGVDPSPALIERAETARQQHPAGKKISFGVGDQPPPLSPEGSEPGYDLVISNLALGDAPDPGAAIAELARAVKPGGRLVITVPLRGSWTEFLDLYADVLTDQGKREGLAALNAYRSGLPDAEMAVTWLERAGFTNVAVEVDRWELLFKSAREFFYAPIIELGPLAAWKQIAGGRGDEMQDVFFFVKEAIDTYFADTVFSVSVVIGCLRGTKPGPAR